MEATNGWIKVHRKMLDNPIVCKDPDHLAVWMYLLLTATHKDHNTLFGGKPVTLKPGQLISGRKKISGETKVEEHKVDRVLKLFKSAQLIEQQSERYGSIISIVNWNKYQDVEQRVSNGFDTEITFCDENDEKTSNKVSNESVPLNTEIPSVNGNCMRNSEQQSEQRVSNERATSEQRVSTKQEYKEQKNVKKDIYSDVPEEIKEAFMEWVAMRKTLKKPITSKTAVNRALNKLNSLSKNPERQIELIEYAIYKNWLSFYPIPDDDKVKKPKKEEPPPKPIDAVPMPDETRDRMQRLGFGNIIGKGENYGT